MANFDGGFSGRPVTLRLIVNQDAQSIEGNYSVIGVRLEAIKVGNTTAWNSDPSYWKIIIHGSQWTGSWSYNFNGGIGQVVTVRDWFQHSVGHNADGSLAIGVYADASDPGGYLGSAALSGTFGLTTIPRATTATYTNPMAAGSAYTVNLPRASTAFTHIVDFYMNGAYHSRIATNAATSFSWTPPMDLISSFPNSPNGTGFMRVHTFQGSTLIGYKDQSVTISAPASVVPDFTTITHAEATAGVASNIGKYVQGISKLALAITGAAGVYGSSIVSYKIEVAGQTIIGASGTTPSPINASGTVTVTGTITDSRGRTKQKTVNVSILPYAPPVINSIAAERSTAAGVPDDDGNYVKITLNAAVQSLVNTTERNALVYKIYSKLRGDVSYVLKDTTTPGGISFNSFEAIGTYDIELAYDFRVEVLDDFSTTAIQFSIATAPIFQHWDADQGVGIGKYRQNGMLDVLGQIYQNDGKKVIDGGMFRKALLPSNYKGDYNPTITFLDNAATASAIWLGTWQPGGSSVVETIDLNGAVFIIAQTGSRDHGGWATLPLASDVHTYNFASSSSFWAGQDDCLRYTKTKDGIVVVEGLLWNTNALGSRATLAVLPVGFRPDTEMVFGAEINDTAKTIHVTTAGEIQVGTATGAQQYISLQFAFPAAGVATWTTATLTGGWTGYTTGTYGVPAYWKDSYGVVWWRGMVAGGTLTDGTAVVVGTAAIRPATGQQQHIRTACNNGFGNVGATATNAMEIKGGNASSTWVSLCVTVLSADAFSGLDWVTPWSYPNSWSPNNTAAQPTLKFARRRDGLCLSTGLMVGGSINARIAVLEDRLIPAKRMVIPAVSNSARARIDMRGRNDWDTSAGFPPGSVVPSQGTAGSWFSFDNLKWLAG